MSTHSITVDAVFEDGVLRPLQPLTLESGQRVTLTIGVQEAVREWPADVAAIYREIEAGGNTYDDPTASPCGD
jgi:predicted DNA-binding antitoxin AbrB/MazE fold protein